MSTLQEKKKKKKKKKASSKTDGGGGGSSASPLIPGGNPFAIDAEEPTGITFEMCVREVVLGKSLRDEGDKDKLERLGRLVTLRWRMPVYRAFFEEKLIDALQRVSEANWVAQHMGADIFFEVRCRVCVGGCAWMAVN